MFKVAGKFRMERLSAQVQAYATLRLCPAYADHEAEASSPFHASSGVLVMSLIQTPFASYA
jgi:hypothetical protein